MLGLVKHCPKQNSMLCSIMSHIYIFISTFKVTASWANVSTVLHRPRCRVKGWQPQIINPLRNSLHWNRAAENKNCYFYWVMVTNGDEQRTISYQFGLEAINKKQKALYVHLLELNLFQHDPSCRLCGCLAFSLPHTQTHKPALYYCHAWNQSDLKCTTSDSFQKSISKHYIYTRYHT